MTWECDYKHLGCKKTGTSAPGKTLHQKNCKFKPDESASPIAANSSFPDVRKDPQYEKPPERKKLGSGEEYCKRCERNPAKKGKICKHCTMNDEMFEMVTNPKTTQRDFDLYYLKHGYKVYHGDKEITLEDLN